MSKLFSLLKIKELVLKNRIVMAPMCQFSSDPTGKANDRHIIHYSTRAAGGSGLIILESTAVEPRGRIAENDLGIWDDDHIPGLRRIVASCKKNGANVGIQLSHSGRKCKINSESIVAPSSISYGAIKTPHELSKNEINGIVDSFAKASKRAYEAGFDMIEIHCAHGYLIDQFLSGVSNIRKDEYGGNAKIRTTFIKKILLAVKSEWPENKPVFARISSEDGNDDNFLSGKLCQFDMIKKSGIDVLNISPKGMIDYDRKQPLEEYLQFAKYIKENVQTHTISGGCVTFPRDAEEMMNRNVSDLIFVGRELLRNPYWPVTAENKLNNKINCPEQYKCCG